VTSVAPALEPPDWLQRGFGVEFSVLDGESGHLLFQSQGQPVRDWSMFAELCRVVASRGRPGLIADEPPMAVLALPLNEPNAPCRVAIAPFVTRPVEPTEDLAPAAVSLGMDPQEALNWACRQVPWQAGALERVADVVCEAISRDGRLAMARRETRTLTAQLSSTYEEINLLYRLTHNLRISQSDEDLGGIALDWLGEVIPAQGFAIQYLPVAGEGESLTYAGRTESKLVCRGCCPVNSEEFTQLLGHLDLQPIGRPTVLNWPAAKDLTWPLPTVRQVILVGMADNKNLFGWLAAFNHADDEEFGSIEASLMSSVGAILGIHGGNIELYRQQSELLAGIVRALTSAIDAKDPYTCGHSDRVAQVAVRIAREFGYDSETLNTIYLSGLLHDIGKIGISDEVLRKPGQLSDKEFEHIQTHVRIGHNILSDLRKLDGVLPGVLHHHESWDGRGYPDRLAEEGIPQLARIVAVADAFDAMGSDRPYRDGMSDEKIDRIFREGAGKQWDPAVVDALFRARDDVRDIVRGPKGATSGDRAAIQFP
jgi:hypothetical protein